MTNKNAPSKYLPGLCGLACGLSASCGGSNVSAPVAYTGTYQLSAIKCNGTTATGSIAALIASPNTVKYTLSTSTFTKSSSNSTCTLTASGSYSQSGAAFVFTGAGNWACSGTGCAAFSTSVLGGDVCTSTTPVGSAVNGSYTYAPSDGVASGASATLTATSFDLTCSTNGQANFISYIGLKL